MRSQSSAWIRLRAFAAEIGPLAVAVAFIDPRLKARIWIA
jgi:hypothetical protein